MKMHRFTCEACGEESEREDKRVWNAKLGMYRGKLPVLCDSCLGQKIKEQKADWQRRKTARKNGEAVNPRRDKVLFAEFTPKPLPAPKQATVNGVPAHLEAALRERVLRGVVR